MISETKGAAMVEVIVSFTLMLLVMAIFSRTISLTGRSAAQSGRRLAAYRELTGDYYRQTLPAERTDQTLRFQTASGEASFSLPVEVRSFSSSAGTIYDVTLK